MKKLIQGIVEFRKNVRPGYKEAFGRLAVGQSPDTLFIACSDSRVVPNTFASTNPGDLFVMRNVGNLVPACDETGTSVADESEGAAIEFSVLNLGITNIIVCGHSECGAMRAIMDDRRKVKTPNLRSWLRHGENALDRMRAGVTLDPELSPINQLSQLNVLLQMENVSTYPWVKERIAAGKLHVHGWWFDITQADVYAYEQKPKKFLLIDEAHAQEMIKDLKE